MTGSPPETEFPRSIGRVATRELALAGYTSFEQLSKATARTLLAIHGVGPKAVRILDQELKDRGLSFVDDGKPDQHQAERSL